jgi:hypothetical protein
MNRLTTLASAALLLCSAGAATAQDLEQDLASLAAAEGQAYVDAREALLAQDGLEAALQARAPEWSEDSWEVDTLAAALEARLTQADLVTRLEALPGVNPARYLMFRKAGPMSLRDLRPLRPVAPVMAEILLKTLDLYAFPQTFPEDMDAATRAGWEAKAKRVLEEGLLQTLGNSGHPSALPVLGAILADGGRSVAARSSAAVGLGYTGQAEALDALNGVLSGDAEAELRIACVRGAASVRTSAALDLLEASLADASLRNVAVAGLGTLGSKWAFEAQGQAKEGEALRERASTLLVQAIASYGADPKVRALACQSLSAVALPGSVDQLDAVANDADQEPAVRDAARQAKAQLEVSFRRQRSNRR